MRASIVGGGVIGCAAGLELRRLGFDVTVIDRNGDVGHGSTSASCGIVRRFYSQPGMIAMAHEASFIWDDWATHLGPIDDDLAVFRRPGMLFLPPRLDERVRGIYEEMKKVGVNVSILSADEITERFPFLDTCSQFPPKRLSDPDFFEATGRRIEGGVFEEDAGYVVSPGLATLNLRRAGERDGVRFLLRREVSGIRRVDGGFELETTAGDVLESEVVLNAAGPHSSKVNRQAGVELPLETRPLRREVHALKNPRFTEDGGAGIPVVGDLDAGTYFRPEGAGRDLTVGSADPECDEQEWVEDPDEYVDHVTEPYRQRQCLRLMKRFPEVRLGPARGVANLYDVTVADWYPIIDRTDVPGYYVAIGTSGSSFKTSPVIGRLIAEIIAACEGGRDTDREPIRFELPRAGVSIDTRFLSRLRGRVASSGTVVG